ncbi:MAG: hypothetical protein AAGF47_00105 [Planctomycetota bacterium]
MADEPTTDTAAADEKPAGGMPKKLLAIVAGIMVLEVAAVGAFLLLSGGGAGEASAAVEYDPETDPDALIEMQVIADRFQNMHTGRVWQWDTELFVQVKRKNEAAVQKTLEGRTAEIASGVGEIIRKATHTQLREPELRSIKRKLLAYCQELFGTDAEGQPRVETVLIPRLRGAPADF